MKESLKDIIYFCQEVWLLCPDNCTNIIMLSFMVIFAAAFGTTSGALILLIIGMITIIVNIDFIKNKIKDPYVR